LDLSDWREYLKERAQQDLAAASQRAERLGVFERTDLRLSR